VNTIILMLVSIVLLIGAGCFGCNTEERTPPIILEVSCSDITSSTATITWTTDRIANTSVSYWIAGEGSSISYHGIHDTALVKLHSVTIIDLKSGTTYSYTVSSKDWLGKEATSEEGAFTTLG